MVEGVLSEWAETLHAAGTLAGGGEEFAREILEHAFGTQKAAFVFKRIQAQLHDEAGCRSCARRTRSSSPPCCAASTRRRSPSSSPTWTRRTPPASSRSWAAPSAPSVVYRMAVMEKVSPEMLQLIERSLGGEAELNLSQGLSASGGPEAVAAVLNLLTPSLEKELLDELSARRTRSCASRSRT